jgi:DNA-directed RNA polymerase delta subunit
MMNNPSQPLQRTGAPAASTASRYNLGDMVKDMFLVLTDKEQDVITRRFSLNNKPKQTLEKIGQTFSVTRERIRQIESIALNKLKRTISNTRFSEINSLAKQILAVEGGIMTENALLNRVIEAIQADGDSARPIIHLSMVIDPELKKQEKTDIFHAFWRYNSLEVAEIKKITESGISLLKKRNDIIPESKLLTDVQGIFARKEKSLEDKVILGALSTDKRLKKVEAGWGLMEWRHINPRSIRDKAYIVLKKHKKPMHFVEISGKISEVGFDKKAVTVQAVHNELIRCDKFVLVGRGLYVLKEWGYKEGTVADVIEDILRKKGAPMTKQEIIDDVLKQRYVRIGTISLNLQKHPQFARVGRAVYQLAGKKK